MWLGGLRNRRADHLIHTLTVDMLPYYETRHNSQELGFDGSNLAQKRRKEILARTPEIEADSIRAAEDDRYYVQSATDPSRSYLVGLTTQSCDCPDWPRVRLCKHVAAVAHFFGKVDQFVDQDAESVPAPPTVHSEGPVGGSGDACSNAASILEKVITVSKDFLSDGVPSSPGTVRSLQSVEAHLTAVYQTSRSSESPLPAKENVPPNQHTWTETAQWMGMQPRPRKRRCANPTTSPSPEPPAAQCIGNFNRKKPRLQVTDPYSGGVNSGRNAAPDAQSAAQNAAARARTTAAANGTQPTPSQARKRGRKRVGSPAPSVPPSPSQPRSYTPHPALPSSTQLPWYPMPAYTPGMYAQTPYYPYWGYGPYGHFPPPSQ